MQHSFDTRVAAVEVLRLSSLTNPILRMVGINFSGDTVFIPFV
jgi:hypothetical protein